MQRNYMKLKGEVIGFDSIEGMQSAIESLDIAEVREIGKRLPTGDFDAVDMDKWRVVWNLSKNKPEDVVSDDYTLLLHRQAFKQVAKAVKSLNTPIQGNVISNGGRAYIEVKFPEVLVDVDGDKIELQVMFCNSYDRSRAFRGVAGGFRICCSNGLILGKMICPELYSQHYGKEPEEMVEQVKKFIKLAISSHPKLSELMSSAMADTMEIQVAEKLLKAFMTIEKHREVLMQKLKELGRNPTRWDMYNIITDYLTHSMSAKYEYVLQMHNRFANKFLESGSKELEVEADALIEAIKVKTEA